MAFAIADGPLGVKGIHTWNGGFVLNDRTTTVVGPRAWVDKIDGWRKKPETDDNRAKRTGRPGEVPLRSLKRGKTLVYNGRLQAPTEAALYVLRQQLVVAFAEDDLEGQMAVAPHSAIGGPVWTYRARVIDFDADDEPTFGPNALPSPWQWHFSVSLRMSDARFYVSGAATAGPWSTEGDATNNGSAATDPVLSQVVTTGGPVTLAVYNDTTHRKLQLTAIPVLVPGTVVWDFAARTIALQPDGGGPGDYVDLAPFLDITQSNWWDAGQPGMQPGLNHLRQVGGTNLAVSFRHASL